MIERSIYAEAGVPEFWIADVGGGAIEVHTAPRDGEYRSVVRIEIGELRPVALPGLAIAIADLWPTERA